MGLQDEQHSQPSRRNRLVKANLHTLKTALRQTLEGGFLFILASRLANIKPVLALRAAKKIVGALSFKDLVAVLAKPQRIFLIGQHSAEHHLNHQKQRVEIPDDCRFIAKLDVIRRSVAVKRRHRLLSTFEIVIHFKSRIFGVC